MEPRFTLPTHAHRAIFDSADEAMAILDAASGRILDANQAMLRLFGFSRDEALSTAFTDIAAILPEPEGSVTPGSPPTCMAKGPRRLRMQVKDKRGTLVPVEFHFTRARLADREYLWAMVRRIGEATNPALASGGRESRLDARPTSGTGRGALAGVQEKLFHRLNNTLTPILGFVAEARSMAEDEAMAFCLDEALAACARARDHVSGLLAARRSDASASPPAMPENIPHHPPRRRVLFIDDEEAIALLVGKQLSSSGFEVTAVSRPDEALRLFGADKFAFDCVVTDLLMPGMSGQELARIIHGLRPETPVLLCSGIADLTSLDQSSARCFAGCIPKPFSKGELIRAIRATLADKPEPCQD